MRQQLIIAAALVAVAFLSGWQVNGWRLGEVHEEYRRDQAQQLAAAEQNAREAERGYRAALIKVDERYAKELTDAQDENDRLRADVLRGAIRLSVPAKCTATSMPGNTGSTSRTDATSRADIDERAAAEILALTERGDRAIRQLSALQAYVRSVCVGGE